MGGVDSQFNTWDLNIAESDNTFESTSDAGCLGPREADGSMPTACAFMKLEARSPLIDKGTDVELPFVAAGPDLGAYELGAKPIGGSGGVATDGVAGSGSSEGGMGGAAGSGGAGGPGPSTGGESSGGGASGSGAFPTTGGGGQAGSSPADAPATLGEAAAGCSCAVASGTRSAHGVLAFLFLALTFARRVPRLSSKAASLGI